MLAALFLLSSGVGVNTFCVLDPRAKTSEDHTYVSTRVTVCLEARRDKERQNPYLLHKDIVYRHSLARLFTKLNTVRGV